ncbi:hypothetical protein [Paraburkholderia tropica]|uniref:hypothetical protein n=1 Tax=Paraburkholderia tropica TaxID=92647 RepID=UPI002AB61038|nr:hypothetical protein [Paraburkholderia tropica]
MRRQLDEASSQFALLKVEFGKEIERERARADATDAPVQSHEKRALREIDQERTAGQEAEQQLERLQTLLTAAKGELKEAAVQHAGAISSLRTELGLAVERIDVTVSRQQATENELYAARASLQEVMRRAERAEAEVEISRRLVDGLKRIPLARGAPRAKG